MTSATRYYVRIAGVAAWALAKCRERYVAERIWYSATELSALWNAEKKSNPELSWWCENSKCAYQQAFRNLDRALHDFLKSRNGERKAKRPGFPRFKKRGRCKDSFQLTGSLHCARQMVTLPRLGTIRTHESTRKLARRLENGTARILSATVSRTAQRWFVAFTVEVDRDIPESHARPGSLVGIDLGVKSLITGADEAGNVIMIPGPKPLRAMLRKLRRLSRVHARKRPGSANRLRATARLARLHARIANVRTDALHKATSMLAGRYETIVVEDLNVAGMVRNRHLARALTDQGLGKIRPMLARKTNWNGGMLVTADRWYPSSKACSECGTAKATLALSERTYHCDNCGLVLDRDVNAARNLLKLAASGTESQNARRATIRPGSAGHVATTREPGTGKPDEPGAVTRQQVTVARVPMRTQPQRVGSSI